MSIACRRRACKDRSPNQQSPEAFLRVRAFGAFSHHSVCVSWRVRPNARGLTKHIPVNGYPELFAPRLKHAASGLAAVGATGVMIAGGVYYGWEVVSRVAETLPWIGVAFCLLNDLVDIADAKFELEVQPLPVFLDATLFCGLLVFRMGCICRHAHAGPRQ